MPKDVAKGEHADAKKAPQALASVLHCDAEPDRSRPTRQLLTIRSARLARVAQEVSTAAEWNVQALEGGEHFVRRHDHETGDWAEIGTFPAEVTLGDLLALLTDRAGDGDFILLPDGSPLVVLDVPEREPAFR